VKPYWVHYKLEKAIEMPYSDLLAGWRFSSHRRVMKSLLMGNVYNLCRV
jgi:hypothetical protein